ncbi:Uncharacterised protein [Sphingobacterium multivorum]|uniref:Uncharacterized protein n=1 Tax=Sphingobacterium multivorum TaxID=28454 RepID=A0A2X2J3E1_SPHMU|nr:Uncharacterised protein [Sphingobacterium multivorum]
MPFDLKNYQKKQIKFEKEIKNPYIYITLIGL